MKLSISVFSTKNLVIITSVILSSLISWTYRDPITSLLFSGKTFSGRSLTFQVLIFIGILLVVSLLVYNIIDYLYPSYLIATYMRIINKFSGLNIPKSEEFTESVDFKEYSSVKSLFHFVALTFVSIIVLFFLEWIFFVSKESFMDDMAILDKLAIVFQSIWLISILSIGIIISLWGILRIVTIRILVTICRILLPLIPSMFLSFTALLIFDNFTYIIFGLGIVNSTSYWRFFYLIGLVLFMNKTIFLINYHKALILRFTNSSFVIVISIMLMICTTTFTMIGIFKQVRVVQEEKTYIPETTPNVILIGADGLNADHLLMYGYQRDTTPFLSSIVDELLIAENNFSNAGSSAGSVVSIFSSKPPFTTGVMNLPDALMGKDAYEHLPGILKEIGYTNTEITYVRYVDAYLANVRNGFDRINGRNVNTGIFSEYLGKIYPIESQYFLDVVFERITDRVFHVFFFRKMPNPYLEITTPTNSEDYQFRVPDLIKTVFSSPQPFFIHTHLLDTHGPYYYPQNKVFSAGKIKQTEKRDADFFDDSIIDFDGYIRQLYSALEDSSKLNNTILIIYSDHPQSRNTTERIPLIIRFPNGEYTGRIKENTQNMDISPTVLSYMGIQQPDWMEGQSMINNKLSKDRFIYSALWRKITQEKKNRVYKQFGSFRIISCDSFIEFDAVSKKWTDGKIDGHTSPCFDDQIPSISNLQEGLVNRIKLDGFNTDIMEENRR